MARKASDVQVQVVMPPAMRKQLNKAALNLQDDVPRDKLMERGPMLGYLARWFLALPEAAQLSIVLDGKGLYDQDAETMTGKTAENYKALSASLKALDGVRRLTDGGRKRHDEHVMPGAALYVDGAEGDDPKAGADEHVGKGLRSEKRAVGPGRRAPKTE